MASLDGRSLMTGTRSRWDRLTIDLAGHGDAATVAALRTNVAADLTKQYGYGHWSSDVTDKSVLRGMRTPKTSRVLVARAESEILGTLRLATKRPWAIDAKHFTPVTRPIYLLDMAVRPDVQRLGIGRRLLQEAIAVAAAWPGDAIRLDAYDAAAGAAGFYAKCGFRQVGRVTYRHVPLVYFERLL
jgi:ribosomal protein S18 acetylase RimI-like enzyme